jgi:hypothetical protein
MGDGGNISFLTDLVLIELRMKDDSLTDERRTRRSQIITIPSVCESSLYFISKQAEQHRQENQTDGGGSLI